MFIRQEFTPIHLYAVPPLLILLLELVQSEKVQVDFHPVHNHTVLQVVVVIQHSQKQFFTFVIYLN